MATDRPIDKFATITPPGALPKITSIMRDFSAEALAELRLWLEQNPPAIGISNILGFQQFTAKVAPQIDNSETTSSTSYVDLATVGPQLTGLPDGQYVLLYGSWAENNTSPGGLSVFSPSINGAAPSDSNQGGAFGTGAHSARAIVATLSNGGSNTVKLQYKVAVNTQTGTFVNRWLFALRFANK